MRRTMRAIGIVLVVLGVLCVIAACLTIKEKHDKAQRDWQAVSGQKPEPLSPGKFVAFGSMPEVARVLYLGAAILGLPGLVLLVLAPRAKRQPPRDTTATGA